MEQEYAFLPMAGEKARGICFGDASPTLDTDCKVAVGHKEREMGGAMEPKLRVRRLTPTECERLMGFPDGWTKIPWKGKPAGECPDGPRYKACGNSMCVNCMEWIGQRIQQVEDKEKKR